MRHRRDELKHILDAHYFVLKSLSKLDSSLGEMGLNPYTPKEEQVKIWPIKVRLDHIRKELLEIIEKTKLKFPKKEGE